jgi:signal transduction histidine kinase
MFQSRGRLFLTLFLMLAIPTAILTFLTASFVWREQSNEAIEQNSLTARLVSKHLEEEFFGLRRYVESFATRRRIVDSLKKMDQPAVQEQVAEVVEQNKKVSRAVLTDTNGVLLFDYPNDPALIGQDFSSREWFREVSKAQKPYVSGIYERVALNKAVVVMVAAKIVDTDNLLLGYLGAQYTVRELTQWLESVETSKSKRIAIFDQYGEQVLRINSISQKNINNHPVIRQLLQQPEGSLYVDDVDGFGRCAVSHVPVPALGWAVIVYEDQTVILSPVKRLVGTIVLFFIASLVALGILGWMWHRVLYAYAEDLQRSNKELENFCYTIAHDLRSPLRGMQGFAEVIKEEVGDKLGDRGLEHIGRITGSAKRMDRLISDLLDYGSIAHRNLDFAEVELDERLEKALQALRPRFEQTGAEIQVRHPLGKVVVDVFLLNSVLQNILSNALKYAAPGLKPKIEIWSEDSDKVVRLWIKDNGIGIAQDHQQRIFGMFHRLHTTERFSGTGVGLAIVKKAVERMGGQVGVESKVGSGSSFWIVLPKS